MIVIKKFDTPTDIYVLGSFIHEYDDNFGITDDYATLDISNGKEDSFIDTCGFFYILTEEELMKVIDKIDTDDGQEGFVIHNYIGEIRLRVVTHETKTDILEEFDPEEYIMQQPKMRKTLKEIYNDDSTDVILEFDAPFPKIITTDELIEDLTRD